MSKTARAKSPRNRTTSKDDDGDEIRAAHAAMLHRLMYETSPFGETPKRRLELLQFYVMDADRSHAKGRTFARQRAFLLGTDLDAHAMTSDVVRVIYRGVEAERGTPEAREAAREINMALHRMKRMATTAKAPAPPSPKALAAARALDAVSAAQEILKAIVEACPSDINTVPANKLDNEEGRIARRHFDGTKGKPGILKRLLLVECTTSPKRLYPTQLGREVYRLICRNVSG